MPAPYLQETILSGASISANGTINHHCIFNTPALGSFLLAVMDGAVTFTTPSNNGGWTLLKSAANLTGLYFLTKTANSSDVSSPAFDTSHNGSNYAIQGVVYEFVAGTTVIGTAGTATGLALTATTPSVTVLTGTVCVIAARSWNNSTTGSVTSCVWTSPNTEDYDVSVPKASQDGIELTIAYQTGVSTSSFSPNSIITTSSPTASGEALTTALNIPAATVSGPIIPTSQYSGMI